ncbi:MAG: O-antigen ligase family protein, partial [Verrucomicrobiae bacterium]|nr:O-antigen ligase family protein [Verrucomicrobiae bacterium]NNJ87146.1 O-antigen ligase family protein [Akkermansiaceae bacterium]
MMSKITNIIVCSALLAACLLGVNLSLPLQSPALILFGLAGLTGALMVWKVRLASHGLLWFVLIAIGYFFVRAWFSPVQDLAYEDLYLIIGAALLYLLLVVSSNVSGGRTSIAVVILVALMLHLGSSIHQLLGGDGYGMVWLFTDATRPDNNAVSGMYGYRGSFANFAMMSGMLSLCLGLWGKCGSIMRLALVLLGIAALVFGCLAFSRSAALSLVVGGIVLLVMLWVSVSGQRDGIRTKFRFGIVLCGVVGAIFVLLASWVVFQNRAQDSVRGADVMFDSNVRLAFWPMAVDQFNDHPVIGAGSRSFAYECFHYWNPNLDTGEANPEFVHNEYLQSLADYGIVGFLLIVGLLGAHLLCGVLRVRSLSNRSHVVDWSEGSNAMALTIAGLVGIVIMSIHVIFDFRTHLMANLLLLVCCLVWVLPTNQGKESGGKPLTAMIFLVLLVISISALVLSAVQLRGGLPLLQNKMASEHGGWNPAGVNRDVWMPNLEKSIEIAPSYRRHLKLGTLYRLEAEDMTGPPRKKMLRKAIAQYEAASARHAYEPVSLINLGSLHSYLG